LVAFNLLPHHVLRRNPGLAPVAPERRQMAGIWEVAIVLALVRDIVLLARLTGTLA
jgi:hypothetical protein